jgi:hypothetical protein
MNLTTTYHPVEPQPDFGHNEAPAGQIWVCKSCMNTSQDKAAPIDETWQPCCRNNSVLCTFDEVEEGETT